MKINIHNVALLIIVLSYLLPALLEVAVQLLLQYC